MCWVHTALIPGDTTVTAVGQLEFHHSISLMTEIARLLTHTHSQSKGYTLPLPSILCTSYHLFGYHGSAFTLSQKKASSMLSLLVIGELKLFVKSFTC